MAIASHLKSFQALELAIRTGSLKNAADLLAITPAAVGQRIKTLEDYLGVDLVVRGRSGLRPTPALSKALPHLTRAFIELGGAAEALDFQRVNEIQIAANTDWAELWLKPRLARFKAAYPNILFCINGEGDVPMRLGHTDIEINFEKPQATDDGHLLLFHDFLLPVGSPANTERIVKLSNKDRLEGFPLLHLDFYKDDPQALNWPKWIAAHRHRRSAPQPGIIRFQRIAPGLEAVASDAGLMICGFALIADRLDKGEICLPFPAKMGSWTSHAFQARFRRDAMLRPQVQRFRDWLDGQARMTVKDVRRLARTAK
jgi:LysR family glycine cleavage system transcriptional activator